MCDGFVTKETLLVHRRNGRRRGRVLTHGGRRGDARRHGAVRELRVAPDRRRLYAALAFYRAALRLPEIADWSSADGRVVVLAAGRATIELLDEAQAAA